MISQKCPKCRSSRIQRGYKPSPLIFRLFGIYNLLCDHCNLLFTGFALPGTVRKRGKRSQQTDYRGTGKVNVTGASTKNR